MRLEKQARLVNRLIQHTRSGAIEWKPAAEEGEFQVSFKDNSVRIREYSSSASSIFTYYIELINAEGAIVESFHDGELDEDFNLQPNSKWYKKMGELYEICRRNALGSDKVLDSILTELDDIMQF